MHFHKLKKKNTNRILMKSIEFDLCLRGATSLHVFCMRYLPISICKSLDILSLAAAAAAGTASTIPVSV